MSNFISNFLYKNNFITAKLIFLIFYQCCNVGLLDKYLLTKILLYFKSMKSFLVYITSSIFQNMNFIGDDTIPKRYSLFP